MLEFLTPTSCSEITFTERRSRFIGRIFPTPTEEDALAALKRMREQHWDATHNVYAYRIQNGAVRYSDDAEPQGTAGMPVLEVLRRAELENVTCIVTRYFGGVLLGAGGLVRAYSKAAALAVEAAGISVQRVWERLLLDCPYRWFDQTKQLCLACGGVVEQTQFGANVTLTLLLPQTQTQSFVQRLTELTAGQLEAVSMGEEYRAVPRDAPGKELVP